MNFLPTVEDGHPLGAMAGGFGWTPGESIGSTYKPPVAHEAKTALDFQTRFHQYEQHFNDRADYSLACVMKRTNSVPNADLMEGDCPVNFKDQITEGNV